jgi:hypothetical protein
LLVVEGSPFWSSVGYFGCHDEAAVHADYFGALVIAHDSCAAAFRAGLNFKSFNALR